MNEFLRIEHDSIGDLEIPTDAYYGVQSLRGAENFKITGHMLHPLFIKNMAKIKKACALVNGYMGAIDETKVNAMTAACDEIIAGGLMIGAFFMATDYVTSPDTALGKVIFGVGCGLITAIIRVYGGYPEGVSFAILLMNILNPYIIKLTRKKAFGGIKV